MQRNAELKDMAQRFAKRLEVVSKEGVPAIGAAPYCVVVAERRGYTPMAQQSLAHCLQNMWLKATSMGLGFQLISITTEMAHDKDFCDSLGFPLASSSLAVVLSVTRRLSLLQHRGPRWMK